jgi:hypothetical protein
MVMPFLFLGHEKEGKTQHSQSQSGMFQLDIPVRLLYKYSLPVEVDLHVIQSSESAFLD